MELVLGNNTHVENPSFDILKPVALDEVTITLTNGSNITESFQFQVPRSRGRLSFMSRDGGGEELYHLVLDRIGFAIGNEKQPLHYRESMILREYGQNHFLRIRPHLFIFARSEPNRPSIDVSGWCDDVEFVEKESYKIETSTSIKARIESVKLVHVEESK